MDEEDDNWSYSFPPSIADISCVKEKAEREVVQQGSVVIDLQNQRDDGSIQCCNKIGTEILLTSSSTLIPYRPNAKESSNLVDQNFSLENSNLQNNIVSSHPFVPRGLSFQTSSFSDENDWQKPKQPSLALQPAFMLKLAPADPQTTRKDASLTISKEYASNALASIEDHITSPASLPIPRTNFKGSVKVWRQTSNDEEHVPQNSDPVSAGDDTESTSPKIITYRKTTHIRTSSNSLKLEDQADRFDPRLYVSEKFKDTFYRYATMKRNVEFHHIFKTIILTDRLLDDFACAISREILLQGRVYITENNLCFNSNLLGWVTSLVVPYCEITHIDKKSTAGLFPNGIIVETKSSKHSFASFLSRDATFKFMRTVWLAATGKNVSDLDSHFLETYDTGASSSSERRMSDYIMSIDEGENVDVKWNDRQFEDSVEDLLELNTGNAYMDLDESDFPLDISSLELANIRTLRPGSVYVNKGPDLHVPTKILHELEGSREEIEVLSEVINAPMGIVFEILFGRENQNFHKAFLKDQGATEITDYGLFSLIDGEASSMERLYTYQRPLGYSIGPKSTKCCVREVIEQYDLDQCVVILCITDTPDVPSGGSFSVMTRFYLTWSENSFTRLKIAYRIRWKGRSWIKSMVEKLTLSAQESVSKTLIQQLRKEVDLQTHITDASSTQILMKSESIAAEAPLETGFTETARVTKDKKGKGTDLHNLAIQILVCLLITLFVNVCYMHFKIVITLSEIKELLLMQQEMLEQLSQFVRDAKGRIM